MDCSSPGCSVHGISQARKLEWVAISLSRGSSQLRDWTHLSCIGRQILTESPDKNLLPTHTSTFHLAPSLAPFPCWTPKMHAASFISSGGKQETIFLRKPIYPKEKTSVFIPFVSLQPRKQHGSPAALLEPSERLQLSFSLLPSMLKLAWSHLEIRPQYVSPVFLPLWWHWLH